MVPIKESCVNVNVPDADVNIKFVPDWRLFDNDEIVNDVPDDIVEVLVTFTLICNLNKLDLAI